MIRLDFRTRPKQMSNPWHLPRPVVLARAYFGVAQGAKRYYNSKNAEADVPLSPVGQSLLEEFRRNGIIRVDEKFEAIADYLRREYFEVLETGGSNPFVVTQNTNKSEKAQWNALNANISFRDPQLAPLFFDPDLNGVLRNYYGRQPYFRNQPLLQRIDTTDATERTLTNGLYHVDHLHQVSIMFLVSRVTEDGLHMRYAAGSNRRLRLEGYYDEREVEARYPIVKVTGEPGTLFMFDTAGIHRAKYIPWTSRRILHLNFTPGHDLDRKKSILWTIGRTSTSYPNTAGGCSIKSRFRALRSKAITLRSGSPSMIPRRIRSRGLQGRGHQFRPFPLRVGA